ncbi:MAG TPA: DUF5063 domain-containing protein [Candidatus Sulfotelmatobacter sp.]
MNASENNTEIADRFAFIAEQFCTVVESSSGIDRTELPVRIYRILPKLIGEAINLPEVRLSDDDDPPERPNEHEPPANIRLNDEQWGQLYSLLKEKLEDWDLHWQAFNPTTDKEAVCGTLADDFADIYRDLKGGLILNQTRQAPPEEIIWDWRLLYYAHWGKLAIDALLTIHFRLHQIVE